MYLINSKVSRDMKRCVSCILPDSFPGITFDNDGKCRYCIEAGHINEYNELKNSYKRKFLEILEKNRSCHHNKRGYDVLLAYSGGKDSTYTLKILKEDYNLSVFAFTFNNGFISPFARKNIERTTEKLGVDHMYFSPSFSVLQKAFKNSIELSLYPVKALERASSICNTCMNMVKSVMIKQAVEMGIPLLAYGWSPGQVSIKGAVMRLNHSMIRYMQKNTKQCLQKALGDDSDKFILQERHFKQLSEESLEYYNIHPMAFVEYDEAKIIDQIQQIEWQMPDDTDANSTNCLLNAFAIEMHIKQWGFHPYVYEIADLVRRGILTRAKGLQKILSPANKEIIKYVEKRLGLSSLFS